MSNPRSSQVSTAFKHVTSTSSTRYKVTNTKNTGIKAYSHFQNPWSEQKISHEQLNMWRDQDKQFGVWQQGSFCLIERRGCKSRSARQSTKLPHQHTAAVWPHISIYLASKSSSRFLNVNFIFMWALSSRLQQDQGFTEERGLAHSLSWHAQLATGILS